MTFRVVDTNVAVVANNRTSHASSACISACITALEDIKSSGGIVIDSGMLILGEYMKNLSLSGQPGAGDAFMKWVHLHQSNPTRCEQVYLSPDASRGFEEFPADPRLNGFDSADRKFVATALKSVNSPIILNAVDSDWWHACVALAENGVSIEFVCPDAFL